MCNCSTVKTDEELEKLEQEEFQTWLRWGKSALAVVVVMMATMVVFGYFAPDYRGPWVSIAMGLSATVGWLGEFFTRPSNEKEIQHA